jgi:hypothetical protein
LGFFRKRLIQAAIIRTYSKETADKHSKNKDIQYRSG